jgi:hypothetical protein
MDNILPEQPDNKWNPFISTERDIQRTDELAAKNVTVAGIIYNFFIRSSRLNILEQRC